MPLTAKRARCRHCRRARVNRPRGLCWTCYYTPGVRRLYRKAKVPANRRGLALASHYRLPLPEPTEVRPGPDKVPIFEARAAAGTELWHPEDGKL